MNELKDQFLATVSHELRTPLNAMLGWASMLRAGVTGDTFNRAIASIERNARSQAQLVEDLLDVSRIIAGKMKLSAVPLDVRTVVGRAADVVRPAAEAKVISLETEVDDAACWVKGDAERLQQVVWHARVQQCRRRTRDGSHLAP